MLKWLGMDLGKVIVGLGVVWVAFEGRWSVAAAMVGGGV